MELRDTVRLMDRHAHDLSYEECEAWMRDLGYVVGERLDWERLMKEAGVGGTQYNLKKRWNAGEAPDQRADIRAHLDLVEQKRRERTPAGARVLGIEEWYRIGVDLSHDPAQFFARMHELRPLAAKARIAAERRRAAVEAEAEYVKASSAWASPVPEPAKPRK